MRLLVDKSRKRNIISETMERATKSYMLWLRRISRSSLKQEKEENRERTSALQEMQISDDKSKKSVSSFEERVEIGEILSSSSEWETGSDELFVTCLNNNSEYKIGKPIKNYLDLFINTSLNQPHMSIWSRLVSQPNKNLNSNIEQSINPTDLSPITFGLILPPKVRGQISTNSQINPTTSDENRNTKVRTIKILLESGASASIIRKDVLFKRTTFVTEIILKLPKLNHSVETYSKFDG